MDSLFHGSCIEIQRDWSEHPATFGRTHIQILLTFHCTDGFFARRIATFHRCSSWRSTSSPRASANSAPVLIIIYDQHWTFCQLSKYFEGILVHLLIWVSRFDLRSITHRFTLSENQVASPVNWKRYSRKKWSAADRTHVLNSELRGSPNIYPHSVVSLSPIVRGRSSGSLRNSPSRWQVERWGSSNR
jgi:hypothetical protein